jgi:hypothetical protein
MHRCEFGLLLVISARPEIARPGTELGANRA